MKTRIASTAVAALVLLLAACGEKPAGSESATGAATPSSKTLAEALDDGDGLDALDGVAEASGLEAVLQGVGPYTVFAPTDAAFTAAGGAPGTDMKAQGATLLRGHIVPGALTRADIEAALSRAGNGKVEMRTMDDGVVSFSRDGSSIRVTAADGASGRLTGSETVASNGVVQPIDGVLAKAAS